MRLLRKLQVVLHNTTQHLVSRLSRLWSLIHKKGGCHSLRAELRGVGDILCFALPATTDTVFVLLGQLIINDRGTQAKPRSVRNNVWRPDSGHPFPQGHLDLEAVVAAVGYGREANLGFAMSQLARTLTQGAAAPATLTAAAASGGSVTGSAISISIASDVVSRAGILLARGSSCAAAVITALYSPCAGTLITSRSP